MSAYSLLDDADADAGAGADDGILRILIVGVVNVSTNIAAQQQHQQQHQAEIKNRREDAETRSLRRGKNLACGGSLKYSACCLYGTNVYLSSFALLLAFFVEDCFTTQRSGSGALR